MKQERQRYGLHWERDKIIYLHQRSGDFNEIGRSLALARESIWQKQSACCLQVCKIGFGFFEFNNDPKWTSHAVKLALTWGREGPHVMSGNPKMEGMWLV